LKKILSVILAIALFTFAFATPALADDVVGSGDPVKGKAVFSANCNVCHRGGKNTVNKQKTLKKETLEKYGMYAEDKIITQVTNGKGAMPAFGKRLKDPQIKNVAAYVLEQANSGWKK